ncbi:MAG: response regulator [Candidatus Tectimicrobiota bacterium]
MHTPPCILIVDDHPMNVDILKTRLTVHGYDTLTACDGDEALAITAAQHPDLMLLDIVMPKVHGLEVCRRLKTDPTLPFMPIIMLTAKSAVQDIIAGLEAGADEYLTKPVDPAALIARVKSMLRIKAFHDTAQEHTAQREAHTAHLQAWNAILENQLQAHMVELERLGHLKRFVPSQLAELLVSAGSEPLLQSQRREVTVVCCAVQGLTTFAETTDLARVLEVLRDYHEAMGPLIRQYEGTWERCAGDGLLVVFNAPLPCPDPVVRAVHLAVAMRQHLRVLRERWRARQYPLDFGVGIAHGQATLGLIGGDDRVEYAVMGAVRSLAAGLCDAAQGGHILLNPAAWHAVAHRVRGEERGALPLQGSPEPMPYFALTDIHARD